MYLFIYYETTKVRNDGSTKQRKYKTTKVRNNKRALRNNETRKQRKSEAKIRKGDAKQRDYETTTLLTNERAMRNNERAMRNNGRAMRNNETAKQRNCEWARWPYPDTILVRYPSCSCDVCFFLNNWACVILHYHYGYSTTMIMSIAGYYMHTISVLNGYNSWLQTVLWYLNL